MSARGPNLWTIPAEQSKNGREHVVPLSEWVAVEFRQLKKAGGRTQWVLPGKDKGEHLEPKLLARGLSTCLKRFRELGIAPFTLHDLRRAPVVPA